MQRRHALKLLGAASAAAALTACGQSAPAAPGSTVSSVPPNAVRVGAVGQLLTQFPLAGSFKRYRTSPQGSEDLFMIRTVYMPRSASGQEEGFRLSQNVVLVARTLVCSGCHQPITGQPIQPQCACSYAGAQSAVCRQSGCRVYAQGLEMELTCQHCGSQFNPETGGVIYGTAELPLYSYRLEQIGPDLYIMV